MRARLLALAVSTAVAILVLEVVARVVCLRGDYPEARIDSTSFSSCSIRSRALPVVTERALI